MAANETEEDGECLNQNQARDIEKISLGKCIFQAEAVLEIEVGFTEAKVGHDLDPREILVRLHSCPCVLQILIPVRTYIVFLHGGYGCVIDGEHQSLVGWCQARHVTAQIADYFRDGWKMNKAAESIDVFREYIQEKRYL